MGIFVVVRVMLERRVLSTLGMDCLPVSPPQQSDGDTIWDLGHGGCSHGLLFARQFLIWTGQGPWAFPGEEEESTILLLPILGVLSPRPGPSQGQRTAVSFSAEPLPVMLVSVGRCGCFGVESVTT